MKAECSELTPDLFVSNICCTSPVKTFCIMILNFSYICKPPFIIADQYLVGLPDFCCTSHLDGIRGRSGRIRPRHSLPRYCPNLKSCTTASTNPLRLPYSTYKLLLFSPLFFACLSNVFSNLLFLSRSE